MDVKDKNNIAALQEYLGKIDEVVQAKKKDRKKIINHLVDMANSYYEETKRLTTENERLKNQLKAAINMKSYLERWEAELTNKLSEVKIKIDDNYKVINRQMSDIAGDIANNKSEIEKIPDGLCDVERKLEPIVNASESMRKAQELFNSKKQEYEKWFNDLETREAELNEREEDISKRESQLESEKAQIEDYERDNLNAINDYERVTNENSDYRRRIDECEKKISELEQELEAVRNEKKELEHQVEELKYQQRADNMPKLPFEE
jgi:chromosome segregation ATPase